MQASNLRYSLATPWPFNNFTIFNFKANKKTPPVFSLTLPTLIISAYPYIFIAIFGQAHC